MIVREYESYAEYLAHQREKTTNPALRSKLTARWPKDLRRFLAIFRRLDGTIPTGSRVLCLGARLGAEVAAMRQLRYDAIGVDLVANPPLVIHGDFHALPFPDDTFALAFSNSVDHVHDLGRFAAEDERVLRPDGHLLVVLPIGNYGRYEARRIDSVAEFVGAFAGWSVIRETSNGKPGASERVEVLMRRQPCPAS